MTKLEIIALASSGEIMSAMRKISGLLSTVPKTDEERTVQNNSVNELAKQVKAIYFSIYGQ